MNSKLVYLIQIAAIMLLEVAILALYILLAVKNRHAFKKHWKPGLLLGIALFLMVVPNIVYVVIHLDLSAVFEHFTDSAASPEAPVLVGIAAGFFGALVLHILCIGWYMVLYIVSASEWTKTRMFTFMKHIGEKRLPWLHIWCAFAFGVFTGVVSVIVFHLLGVEEGEMFDDANRFFPGMLTSSSIWGLLISIPVLIRIAIVEELVYRGGIFAFLISKARNNRLAIIASLIIVSLTWAVAHIPNTNTPLIKITQVFIIGLFLGEFARRSCIESAMAAHIGINISGVTLEFILSNIC